MALAARPNAKVAGGAGALMASLRRVRWTMPRPDTFRTSEGINLFIGEGTPPKGTHAADPRALRKWLIDAHEMEVMRASTIAKEINNVEGEAGYGRQKRSWREENEGAKVQYFGETQEEVRAAGIWRRPRFATVEGQIIPWLWPMKCIYKAAKRNGSGAAAASMRALVEGGWWCRARLEAIGAGDGKCRCGKAQDIVWHRLAACELTRKEREENLPKEVLEQGIGRVWDPLYSRGVPARPIPPKILEDESWFEALATGTEFVADNRVYTDGSAAGWHWRGARAAYGAVCYDAHGEARWVLRGICGGPHANIVEAELRAVLEVLRVTVGPVTIMVDNAYVVEGFQKGSAWTTRAGAESAGTWRLVWQKMSEVGEWVTVHKVKAHTSWWEVMGGNITYMDHKGNTAADRAAKEALKVGMAKAPIKEYNAALARAVLWARWVVKYAGFWAERGNAEEEEGGARAERAEVEEEGKERAPRNTLTHDIWKRKGQLLCRRCGRTKEEEGGKKAAMRCEACKGCAAGKILAANTHNANHYWSTYKWSEAELNRSGYTCVKPTKVPDDFINERKLSQPQGGEIEAWAKVKAQEEEGGGTQGVREAAEDEGGATGGVAVDETGRQAVAGRVAHGTAKGKHAIRTSGGITWCDVCGAYAVERAGTRLMGTCQPQKTRHAATRLERLRKGLHPIVGKEWARNKEQA